MTIKAVTAIGQVSLGDAGPGRGATKLIQLAVGTAAGLSITIKGRRSGSTMTPYAIPYKKRYVNGVVGDESFGSAALTTDSCVEVNAQGLDIIADVTAISSGAASLDTVDL